MAFTPPTPNLADPLNVDQSPIQTPTSQQHTSPQKDTFHHSYHRQSKRALTFNDIEPHDSTQLPQPTPLKDYADSSKEHLCKDDDNPASQLSKKQHLSISSPEKIARSEPDAAILIQEVTNKDGKGEACAGLKAPASCPINCFRADPVCGVDGVTYWCGCADAMCSGTRVAKLGACEVGSGGSASLPGSVAVLQREVMPPGAQEIKGTEQDLYDLIPAQCLSRYPLALPFRIRNFECMLPVHASYWPAFSNQNRRFRMYFASQCFILASFQRTFLEHVYAETTQKEE
ncbi:hypothetical protein POTOM_048217 [Populus tomentosa]|uniref:Kazal-like domain-containing protein n=1 Tax=Populus tomentosa TaxID=118781 RepID=A0A8X7YNN5_POPTO|nr:hypothetical protein POTOM_048217 [Populus tomentosa]